MAEKEDLEKQKLEAEIKEIELKMLAEKSKIELEKKSSFRENLRGWVTLLIAIGTLITGGFTIGKKTYSSLTSSATQNEVKVTNEMIELVNKLSASEGAGRDYAAVILSSYGEEAVPILLKSLEWSGENPETLIDALKLIKNRDIKKDYVLVSLLKSAKVVFERELPNLQKESEVSSSKPSGRARRKILNYVQALREVGDEEGMEVKKILIDLQDKIEKRVPPVKQVVIRDIKEEIGKAF